MITVLTIMPFGYRTWPKVHVISPPHSNLRVASVPVRPVSSPQAPRWARLGSGGQRQCTGCARLGTSIRAPFCWLLRGLLSWGDGGLSRQGSAWNPPPFACHHLELGSWCTCLFAFWVGGCTLNQGYEEMEAQVLGREEGKGPG